MTVEDPDAAFDRAVAAGATVVWPVSNQHGWRLGRIVDPFGHHWEIANPCQEGSLSARSEERVCASLVLKAQGQGDRRGQQPLFIRKDAN